MELKVSAVASPGTGNSATENFARPPEKDRGKGAEAEPAEKKKKNPPARIDEIVSEVSASLKRLNTELRIEVDKSSDEVIVKIVDKDSGSIIKEIPPEEMQTVKDRMEDLRGILYRKTT